MKPKKLGVILLALLLAAMAIVPIVRTAETFPAETKPDRVENPDEHNR
jgi:hypothetical protein